MLQVKFSILLAEKANTEGTSFTLFRNQQSHISNSHPILDKQTMKTTQLARYAIRLNYGQVNELANAASAATGGKSAGKNTVRSAALLAALGIGLSSFSMKQMVTKQPKRKY